MTEKSVSVPHTLIIDSRNRLSISGVTEIGAFDEENLVVYTSFGELTLTGEGIQVSEMNAQTGQVTAQGRFDSMKYSDKTAKKSGFLARVFK